MLNILKVQIARKRFRKNQANAENTFSEWVKQGRPADNVPHIVKQKAIRAYRERYRLGTLVETGTYLGDMVEVQLHEFDKVISIELSQDLYDRARLRFRRNPNVQLHQGDSGKVLHKVVPALKEPALFWLDGHYSHGITARGEKDCPIFEELDAIFKNDIGHVLLIDDARGFVGKNDYPTMEELKAYIKGKNPAYNLTVEDDIIRVVKG